MVDDLRQDPEARQKRHSEEERTEEPQKGYETILEQEILSGLTELKLPSRNLFLSGGWLILLSGCSRPGSWASSLAGGGEPRHDQADLRRLAGTFAIGFAHLHHAIVGTTGVLAGVFSGQGATVADFGRFLLPATVGNVFGGFFFVALIKYGHAHRA